MAVSDLSQPRSRVFAGKRTFTSVASQVNAPYVQGLGNHLTEELRRLAPHGVITLHQVPGAFEIPVVVRELAAKRKADAIIAMAVILKGRTNHAEHVGRSVTNALQQTAVY